MAWYPFCSLLATKPVFDRVFHTIPRPVANVTEILESSLFLWGLALGTVALVVIGVLAKTLRSDRPLPLGGLSISVATMIAITLGGEESLVAWAGLAALVVLTAGVGAAGWPARAVALASLPGAAILAFAVPADPWWFRLLVFASVPIAGHLGQEFDSRYGHLGLGVLFFGLACLGTFLAVPDTELPRALLAAAFPIMFLAWPSVRVSLGRTGAFAAVGVFAISTVNGGVGRSASVIGGMACLGLLVLEPLVVRIRPRLARLPAWLLETPEAAVMATIPQVVLVFVSSRVAGPMEGIGGSLLTVAVLYAVFALLLLWTERRRIPELDDESWLG
jgi:hypothetical protein